jgi:hypothetical protein
MRRYSRGKVQRSQVAAARRAILLNAKGKGQRAKGKGQKERLNGKGKNGKTQNG